MCGIVGLFLKTSSLENELGLHFSRMLATMASRGPDSSGIAMYGNPASAGSLKVTLQHPSEEFDWSLVAENLSRRFSRQPVVRVISTHAVFTLAAREDDVRALLAKMHPDVTVMSVGTNIEIMKEVGTPESVIARFKVERMTGTHAIGHTRMATESAVTTQGSHPFSTGFDLCLVHNGSLSNHSRLRENLRREGIVFRTDNDSEVAAGYLTSHMRNGETLSSALTHALDDLDGFYTFTVGTSDGFAVLRDRIACKPAILAETDDYVAMASEYRALAMLPGISEAKLWEPEPATVYSWRRSP
jgi:methylamine---glutamate N-methyltransferase subunit A